MSIVPTTITPPMKITKQKSNETKAIKRLLVCKRKKKTKAKKGLKRQQNQDK